MNITRALVLLKEQNNRDTNERHKSSRTTYDEAHRLFPVSSRTRVREARRVRNGSATLLPRALARRANGRRLAIVVLPPLRVAHRCGFAARRILGATLALCAHGAGATERRIARHIDTWRRECKGVRATERLLWIYKEGTTLALSAQGADGTVTTMK
jgi:hypothetical protein